MEYAPGQSLFAYGSVSLHLTMLILLLPSGHVHLYTHDIPRISPADLIRVQESKTGKRMRALEHPTVSEVQERAPALA